MEITKSSKSIHLMPPLEIGGVEARRGFAIQDHVGVKWCVKLLENQQLEAVWFESQDDLTLIWDNNGQEKIEFVQVKGSELDQLWSVAKLCDRKKSNGKFMVGTSILERSLAYDRFSEMCTFRMVTTRPVQTELSPLKYSLGSQARTSLQSDIENLFKEVGRRIGSFKSENNNGHDYWISHVVWEEIHSFDSIRNDNLCRLKKIVEQQGEYLFNDQLNELYEKLLTKVYDAGLIRWRDDPGCKKFKKDHFFLWFREQLTKITKPESSGGSELVQKKMERAQIPQDAIDNANEERRRYREELLRPQYLKTKEMRLIEGEVIAALQGLRSQLDASIIEDSGIEFHARCLRELAQLSHCLQINPSPPLAFLHGFMYSIVGRCLHRFVRAEIL